jgi:hypothetical protein
MGSRTTLLLTVIGAAVVLALVLLLVKVTRPAQVAIDEDKLAQAKALHEQLERERARAAPTVPRRAAADWRDQYEPTRPGEPESTDEAPLALGGGGTVGVGPVPRIRAANGVGDLVGAGLAGGSLVPRMDDANALYDRSDYDGARAAALEVLREEPDNARMLRIVVSTSCIMGDSELAARHFERLTQPSDRRQMAVRCSRYGVELEP